MDTNVVSELISTVGFPITCVIALAYFAFYMVKKSNENAAAAMEKLQTYFLIVIFHQQLK